MMARGARLDPPAIVRRISWFRCACPTCVGLDFRYPDQGFQLALWPYEPMPEGLPRPLGKRPNPR